jgi:hypothetical protein
VLEEHIDAAAALHTDEITYVQSTYIVASPGPALRGTAERNAAEASALGGDDGLPPRLEVRASFDDDGFVVAVVFGAAAVPTVSACPGGAVQLCCFTAQVQVS